MGERFSLREVLAEERDLAPFQFDGPNGEPLELPHASMMTTEQAVRMDRGDIEGVLRELAGRKVADVVMALPAYATEELTEAWLEHAGMRPGESSASRTSSRNTAGPSRQTSKRRTK